MNRYLHPEPYIATELMVNESRQPGDYHYDYRNPEMILDNGLDVTKAREWSRLYLFHQVRVAPQGRGPRMRSPRTTQGASAGLWNGTAIMIVCLELEWISGWDACGQEEPGGLSTGCHVVPDFARAPHPDRAERPTQEKGRGAGGPGGRDRGRTA